MSDKPPVWPWVLALMIPPVAYALICTLLLWRAQL